MGKHTKIGQAATAIVEARDFGYWWRMLRDAQEQDCQLIVDRCYVEFDKLLDARLAAR